jgi:hypothetical protein
VIIPPVDYTPISGGRTMRAVLGLAVATMFAFGSVNVAQSVEPEKKPEQKIEQKAAPKVEQKEEHGCLFHMESMKDVKYEVTNTADGVTIKITTDKPELVKQIQESVAKCRASCCKPGEHKGCPMKGQENPGCHHQQQEQPKK